MSKMNNFLILVLLVAAIETSYGFTDKEVKGLNKFIGSVFGTPTKGLLEKYESMDKNVVLFSETYRVKILSKLMIPINRVAVQKGAYFYSTNDQGVGSIFAHSEKIYTLKCGEPDPEVGQPFEKINDNVNITENVMKIENGTVRVNGKLDVQFPENYKTYRMAQYLGKVGYVVAFKEPHENYGHLYAVDLDSISKKRWKSGEKIQANPALKDLLQNTVKDVAVDQLTGNLIMAAGVSNSDYLQMLEKIYPTEPRRSERMLQCPTVEKCPKSCNKKDDTGIGPNQIGFITMKNTLQRASDMIMNEFEEIMRDSNSPSFCSLEKSEIEKIKKENQILQIKLEQSRIMMDQMRNIYNQRKPITMGSFRIAEVEETDLDIQESPDQVEDLEKTTLDEVEE